MRKLAVLVAFIAASCGSERATSRTFERDSAGIRIVEGEAPSHSFIVSDQPVVRIGAVEGDERYLLSGVAGVVRLDDGRIVVADRGSGFLRVYDGEGRHVGDWGGRGEGPGESRSLRWLGPYRGDSLIVGDLGARRLLVFAQDGTPGRIILPQLPFRFGRDTIPSQSCCIAVGSLADGSIVIELPWLIPVGGDGMRRAVSTVLRFDAEATSVDTIGRFPAMEYVPMPNTPNGIARIHFGSYERHATYGEQLYATDGGPAGIRVYAADGTLVAMYREMVPAREATDAMKRAYEEHTLASYRASPEYSPSDDERIRATPYAPVLPAYDRVHVDRTGRIWAREYARYWESGAHERYSLFSPEGVLLGNVDLPPRFFAHDMGEDWVLGLRFDEDNVEFVELYRLQAERAAGGNP